MPIIQNAEETSANIVKTAHGQLQVSEGADSEKPTRTKRPRRTDYPQVTPEQICQAIVDMHGKGELDQEGDERIVPFDSLLVRLNWPGDAAARAVFRQRYNQLRVGRNGMPGIGEDVLPKLSVRPRAPGTRIDTAALRELLISAGLEKPQ